MSNAIVISGGGAYGAWGVGVAQGLAEGEGKREYTLAVGTSTGSLMAPMVLLGEFPKLMKAYTTIKQEDIFNVNPFHADGSLKKLNFIERLITGKNTIGETENLRKTIGKFFAKSDLMDIRKQKKEFVATTVSMSTAITHYKSTDDNDYQDMVDWMWTSANQPVFMSLVNKDNQYWADGGTKELLPIKYPLQKKAKCIDVIIHSTTDFGRNDTWEPKGILSVLEQTLSIFMQGVGFSDVIEAQLSIDADPDLRGTEINFYYMTEELLAMLPGDLVFDANVMNNLYKIGLNSLQDGSIVKESYRYNEEGKLTKEAANDEKGVDD